MNLVVSRFDGWKSTVAPGWAPHRKHLSSGWLCRFPLWPPIFISAAGLFPACTWAPSSCTFLISEEPFRLLRCTAFRRFCSAAARGPWYLEIVGSWGVLRSCCGPVPPDFSCPGSSSGPPPPVSGFPFPSGSTWFLLNRNTVWGWHSPLTRLFSFR